MRREQLDAKVLVTNGWDWKGLRGIGKGCMRLQGIEWDWKVLHWDQKGLEWDGMGSKGIERDWRGIERD